MRRDISCDCSLIIFDKDIAFINEKKQLQKGTVSLKKNRCKFSGACPQILRAVRLSGYKHLQ